MLTVFVGKSEGKRPLGRHRRRWKNNTKTDLKNRDVRMSRDGGPLNTAVNLRVP